MTEKPAIAGFLTAEENERLRYLGTCSSLARFLDLVPCELIAQRHGQETSVLISCCINEVADRESHQKRRGELMVTPEVQLWIDRNRGNAMPYAEPRSLQQIKRETEQTRAGLTETVEQLRTGVTEAASDLRERIRPEAIKAEVSDYIKSRGEQLLNDVTAAARRNPMQAVAVGASVAYPLLRLARAIPMPILMVGAGLFFAGSKTGQAAVRKASEVASDLSDEAMGRARDFGNQVGNTVSAAKTYASERIDQVSAAVAGGTDQPSRPAGAAATTASASRTFQDKASSFGASVSDRARDAKNSGVSMASSAAETLQDIASGAASAGRRTIGTVAEAGLDAAKAARQKASDLTERTGKTIFETIEQNPLLVAGVGLVVGGLIASALPRSDLEDEFVGNASSAVKRRAEAAASQGFDAARTAVEEVYDQTARQAESEGLTTDGISKAAQDIGQRVRHVAESAVTTAFEPAQNNQHSGAHGETHHD